MTFRLAPVWWSVGALLVVAVAFFSLVPPGDGMSLLPDKLVHFTAYFVLGFWFVSLFSRRTWVPLLAVVTLGGVLELLQGMTSYRQADGLDFLANSFGAVLAALFVFVMPVNLFSWLERQLLPNRA